MNKYINQVKQFKNPSSYYQYRGKRFKLKILYGTLFAGGLLFYSQYYKTDLLFHFNPTQDNLEIIQNCQQLRKGIFRPTLYLFTPLLQSIYGAKIDPVPYIRLDREFINTSDGGQISLDWAPIHNKFEDTEDQRILIIFHGLSGGSNCNYIRHAALNGYRFGFRTVCMNFRGVDSPLKNHLPTDLTKIDDIQTVVDYVQQKYPKAKLYGMGISFGAAQLIKYVGQTKDKCKFSACVSISNPWDIYKASLEIANWKKGIYNYFLTQNLIRNLKRNIEQTKKNEVLNGVNFRKIMPSQKCYYLNTSNQEQVMKCKTSREYDELYTNKIFKFPSVDEMYQKAGCVEQIKDVQIPILAIQSLDDPVCIKENIPKDQLYQNQNFILVMTQKGGHIEYLTSYKAIRWVYWPAMEFLDFIDKRNAKNEIEI